MCHVDNAVIMAAGTASRLAPLSRETPKALIEVRGEILVERQIRQLHEAGIADVVVVTGYSGERFAYLRRKLGVTLVENDSYLSRNNNASIYAARGFLRNTYVCSCDNYFVVNPFEREVPESYYSAVYASGDTPEWCLRTDEDDYITGVTIGGRDSWHMLGHAFWSEDFSRKFLGLLLPVYDEPATARMYWENIFMLHLRELKMKIRRYPAGVIREFDSLDDLREFDPTYVDDARSSVLKAIAAELGCRERDLSGFKSYNGDTNEADGFTFRLRDRLFKYDYGAGGLTELRRGRG